MPTYDYVCRSCGHELEHFQSMSDKRLTKCPVCKKATLVRKVGAGAGVIFKGSGFYQTDYKAKQPSETAAKDAASKESPKEAATESSPKGASSEAAAPASGAASRTPSDAKFSPGATPSKAAGESGGSPKSASKSSKKSKT